VISGRFQRVRIDGSVKSAAAQKDWDCEKPIILSSAREPLWFLVPD
jgi:hypothetical protein